MRTVTYKYYKSSLAPHADVMTLKTAWLFADKVISACAPEPALLANEWFKTQAFNTKRQLIVLLAFVGDDEEKQKQLREMIDMVKLYNKRKYRSPQELSFKQRFERGVNDLFNSEIAVFEETMKQAGAIEFQKIIKENDGFDFYRIDMGDMENADDGRMPASEILLSIGYPVDDGPEIFLLPPDFFSSSFLDEITVYSSADEEASEPSNIYMDAVLTFPDTFTMTAVEAKAVRKQLRGPSTGFCRACDEWINYSLENNHPAGKLSFFKQHILPAAGQLQQAINSSDIIQQYASNNDEWKSLELLMGEVPVSTVWDFYHHSKSVSEKTWSILQKEKEEDPQYMERFPVMAIRAPYLFGNFKLEMPVQEVKATKKSISID